MVSMFALGGNVDMKVLSASVNSFSHPRFSGKKDGIGCSVLVILAKRYEVKGSVSKTAARLFSDSPRFELVSGGAII